MMRLVAVISFCFIFCLGSPSSALAGFEWVPPSQNPASTEKNVPNKVVEAIDVGSGFALPPVAAMPLDAPPQVQATLSGSPSGSITDSTPLQKRNLSGKKLVIDPYPLRNNVPPPQGALSMNDMHQAMNEASGNFNPVQLGNGMKTSGIRPRVSLPVSSSVPSPERVASTSPALHKDLSMTPMIGGEPAPLHGVAIPREPVMNQQAQGQFAHAIGFGRELPLALALSQVVPSEFTHSYAQGVDSGVSVSWEGGKPWNVVLNEMLRPVGMIASVQGKAVSIQPLASL